MVLDGTTQPGFAVTPIIVLGGTGAGSSAAGVIVDANGSTIRGLVIDGFGQDGISVQGNDNTIAGDYVGVDRDRHDRGGQRDGHRRDGRRQHDRRHNGRRRDIISGNTNSGDGISIRSDDGNVIAGNVIGTDVTGTVAVANQDDGMEIARIVGQHDRRHRPPAAAT